MKKYQECNLLIKIYRRRWQVLFIFRYYLYVLKSIIISGKLPSKILRDLYTSMWQIKANWTYDFEDIKRIYKE